MRHDNLLGIPKDDFNRIYDDVGFSILRPEDSNFDYSIHDPASLEAFAFSQEIVTWMVDLSNRITQATWSGVGLVYWKEQGIPDERDRADGADGGIKYFPDFQKEHYFNKAMFSYFSSVFQSKIYAAWDNIGQILNLMYDLKIDKVDFHKAVAGLQASRPNLHSDLQAIIDSAAFKELKRFRHDTTHNELPTGVSGTVGRMPNGFTFGGGAYTKSADILANAMAILPQFKDTLEAIKKQIALDK